MRIVNLLTVLPVLGAVAACSIPAGQKPGEIPPRLTVSDGRPIWENTASFGAVPADKLAEGQAVCARYPGGVPMRPVGYHPRPLAPDGSPHPYPGYLCAAKLF